MLWGKCNAQNNERWFPLSYCLPLIIAIFLFIVSSNGWPLDWTTIEHKFVWGCLVLNVTQLSVDISIWISQYRALFRTGACSQLEEDGWDPTWWNVTPMLPWPSDHSQHTPRVPSSQPGTDTLSSSHSEVSSTLLGLVSEFQCEFKRGSLHYVLTWNLKSHCLWRCRVGTCKCLPQRGGWCLWCLYFVFQQMDAGLWLPRYASQ